LKKSTSVENLLEFIDASPSPYHAVDSAIQYLNQSPTTCLKESDIWKLKPSTVYYITRNNSSLVAFKTPSHFKSSHGFHILAAHTDSPCLKLKPNPKEIYHNYNQWTVEVYGGALYNSWLDRDLGISGQVVFKTKNGLELKRFQLKDAKIRIPQLAIHLDNQVNELGLKLNPQTQLTPVFSLGIKTTEALKKTLFKSILTHGKNLESILSFDLYLHDTQPSTLGGLNQEFIYAPRLDNLAMCHAGLEAFRSAKPSSHIPVIFLFDNEEVGSETAQGARSNFLSSLLERIHIAMGHNREDYLSSLPKSFLISTDMAHAIHPNYAERHDANHMPKLGEGPVIKNNAKMRYATNSESSAQFMQLCQKANVPYQLFSNRTDLNCGTTIGPAISALGGIPTVDVGNPMLSMHSVREMAGSQDHEYMIKVLQTFLSQ